jgi:hypothetical protein
MCYLRPSPEGLSYETHPSDKLVNLELERQKWYPPQCYYCPQLIDSLDSWQNHVVRKHPGKVCFPGPAPYKTRRLMERIFHGERKGYNFKDAWVESDRTPARLDPTDEDELRRGR